MHLDSSSYHPSQKFPNPQIDTTEEEKEIKKWSGSGLHIHSSSSCYSSKSFPKSSNAPQIFWKKKKTRNKNFRDCISTHPPPVIRLQVSSNHQMHHRIFTKKKKTKKEHFGIAYPLLLPYYPSQSFPKYFEKRKSKERRLRGLHIHSDYRKNIFSTLVTCIPM